MTKVSDLLNLMNETAPLELAQPWDNCGLIVGNPDNEVTGIVIDLDITLNTVKQAVENNANLIISHHPVIFDPVHTVTKGSVIYEALKNDISCICMHTNLDAAKDGINDTLAALYGLTDVQSFGEGLGRYGKLHPPMYAPQLKSYLSALLKTDCIRYRADERIIKTIALVSGNGSSMIDDMVALGVDAIITGEVKHHDMLRAFDNGVCVFDAGHYETERVILPYLKQKIDSRFDLKVTIANNPYSGT